MPTSRRWLTRQLVAIIDPHVKRTNDLYVYTEGKELDVLYKDADGNEFDGWCWTGSSAWVDFFNPKASSWWIGLYKFAKFKGSTRNLFVWNDMNGASAGSGRADPRRALDLQRAGDHRA